MKHLIVQDPFEFGYNSAQRWGSLRFIQSDSSFLTGITFWNGESPKKFSFQKTWDFREARNN